MPVKASFVRPGARDLYLGDRGLLRPATAASAGLDLVACLGSGADCDHDFCQVIAPGQRLMVPTGISVQPGRADVAGFIYSRSGLGTKEGLVVAQGVGVVDPDYTGEIFVCLLNNSDTPREIRTGQRIAQLVFQPICRPCWEEVPSLEQTGRGAGGFGHTGR